VVLSKRDLIPEEDPLPAIHAPESRGLLAVSSAARVGLEALTTRLWEMAAEARRTEAESESEWMAEDADDG
ncbi:MAG: hypothetical protein ACRENB_10925, partial [Gemmatimonadales bacterium]